MNIYVSNLSFHARAEDLKGYFIPFGEVVTARIINDKLTGRSRGYGFVEMKNDTAARNAIKELHHSILKGRDIRVVEAEQKDERAARSTRGSGPGNFH